MPSTAFLSKACLGGRRGERAYRRVRDGWADAAALGKTCTADDVAQTIVWLAVDAALVTGQLLTVDGGFLLGRPTRVAR